MASSWRQISTLSATAAAAMADDAARRFSDGTRPRKYDDASRADTVPTSVASPTRRGAPIYVRMFVVSPSRRVTTTLAGPNVQFAFDEPCPCIVPYTVI